jgi:hypothetical protein
VAEPEHDMSHSAGAPGPTATGPIAWMAKNPVAANLMMFFLLVGGLLIGGRVKQEVFPRPSST